MNKINNITSNLSIRIIRGFEINHKSDWREKRTKTKYTLWSVTNGNVYIKINNKEFKATKGDAVLFYPGNSYTAYTDSDGCSFIYIFFSLEIGNGLNLFSGTNFSGVLSGKNIRRKSVEFQKDFKNERNGSQNLSLKLYSAFFSYLCEIIYLSKTESITQFVKSSEPQENPSIQKALNYIAENYSKNITVKELAKLANLSEKRFIGNFTLTVGLAPGQYITQCKMKKAAELISYTDKKISEIAQFLGYGDQYSFSKAFKKNFGESPTEFRKNIIL